jgi:hypothetical protein
VNWRKASVATVALALAACVLGGCASSGNSATYTPITGILIRASELTAGFGCGTDPGEVYAYAALLSYSTDASTPQPPVFSLVNLCFADGQFSNLPAGVDGSLSFDVTVYAWDQASFPAALQCFPPTPANPSAAYPCPGDVVPNVLDAADGGTTNQGRPNWSTTCTATQQPGVSVIAVCAPLTPTGGAVGNDGGLADAAGGDGGVADAPGDAAETGE